MSVKVTRIQPLDADIRVLLADTLSPKAQSKAFADYARQGLTEAQNTNRRILGYLPKHRTVVDQQEGAPLESVSPNGTIVFEFELIQTMLEVIGEMLVLNSPVLTGQYQSSHALFADGSAVEPGSIPPAAEEYAFVNSQPYARKIERGQSPQAPDGVYDTVAAMAQKRYGNIARVRFSYRSLPSDAVGAWASTASARAMAKRVRGGRESLHHEWLTRQPAIIVTPGR